ncbi:MAG: hypothetical protein NVV72_10400 [Asticcacaulis sp.]|nr:hypothetical protein [Asticcacaulis sp.]
MENRITEAYARAKTALQADRSYKWLTGVIAAVMMAAGLSDLGAFSHGVLTWLNTHFDRLGVAIAYRLGCDIQVTQLFLIYATVLPFWISGVVQRFWFKEKKADGTLDYLVAIFCTWFLWAIWFIKMFAVLLSSSGMTREDEQMILLISSILSGFTCVVSCIVFGVVRGLFKLPGYSAYLTSTLLPPTLLFGYMTFSSASVMHAQHYPFYRTSSETVTSGTMTFIEFFLPVLIALNASRVRLVGLLLMVICVLAFGYDYLVAILTSF